ncbi:hypothetical protein B296_00013264 [Ensete ventricosum]|uniref:Uncharacterized protein n=1 Tax=Ensete ventricosum TaxID=4639 RepID=A0A427ARI0_ENSVE|nr:hypothetical protein B296_00013264 [Ensete ventricosum]
MEAGRRQNEQWSYSRPDAGKVGTPHLQTHASLQGRRAWWGARRHGGGYGGMWSYSRPDAGKVGTPHLQTHAHCKDDEHGGGHDGMVEDTAACVHGPEPASACSADSEANASTRQALDSPLTTWNFVQS